ncbi:hypothetical protein RHS04_02011 [Rhizoctonia solani]|uniref:Uncharacterized protein n=1 Tax=Rhizoctonia solani TaxID=456999 RepID=A0A8H7HGD6_9AGAM|nr:hypothetical protein RHS04_02011 [Rhizoctonia solani]
MSLRPSEPSSPSLAVRRPAPSEPPRERTKRRKGLNAMTDAEAEKYDDEKILARNPSQPESVVTCQPLDNGNIWTQRHTSSAAAPPQLERDSMTEYLSMNVENSAVVAQSGGVLGYWSSRLAQRPRVARFALDFLTAPDVDPVISGPDGGRILVRDAATPQP